RKINVGVAVAPPNVVHTAPYVAKALGFFAKHCVEANTIQFEGGAAGPSVTAVAQGTAISNLPDVPIARGLKGKQIWGLAPRPPQGYVVPESVKTAADLKGKRLSAAGGVGGFNWIVGRAVLRSAGLSAEDAQFISQGTAGRLPGFLAGQIEGVVLHPEDIHLALAKKPGAHVLMMLTEGFVRERTEWTHQNNIDTGDIEADKKLTFEQIADVSIAKDAVEKAGGRQTIANCKD